MATRKCLDCGNQRELGKPCLGCKIKADREAAEMILRGHWVPGMASPDYKLGDTRTIDERIGDLF